MAEKATTERPSGYYSKAAKEDRKRQAEERRAATEVDRSADAAARAMRERRRRENLERNQQIAVSLSRNDQKFAGASERIAKERAASPYTPSSDPLNILPENAKRAAIHQKGLERQARKDKRVLPPRTAGESVQTVDVVDHFFTRQRVSMRGSNFLLNCEAHQQDAGHRFVADHHIAFGENIKSPSFDVKVDGGGAPGQAHISRVGAQSRMEALRKILGTHDYVLLGALLVMSLTVSEIHAAGGEQHATLRRMAVRALDRCADFYGISVEYEDRTTIAIRKLTGSIFSGA